MFRRAIAAYQSHSSKVRLALRFAAYFLGFFFILVSRWVGFNFGSPTLEQILYHVKFGSEGLLSVDPALILSFLKRCIVLPALLAGLVVAAEQLVRLVHALGVVGAGQLLLGWAKRLLSLGLRVAYRLSTSKLPLAFVLAAGVFWTHKVSGFSFIASYFGPDYFSVHYVPPQQAQLKAGTPKNLVLIYVESLEAAYGDRKLFGEDLLVDLKQLGGVSFDRYRQAPGTQWTIAAITASQCGVPLKVVTMRAGNTQGQEVNTFLPGATCLGDVLAAHGYRNVFMGGAGLDFAGKGKFFRDHGYGEMFGREEWIERGIPPASMHGWGLYDHHLFAQAKRKLEELQAEKKPFNLTLLTVDTHHPTGFFSPTCRHLGAESFENIVKCSSSQVAEFVRFIQEQGYMSNTNVVIVGDHLSMPNRLWSKLISTPDRYIFNTFLSSTPPQKNRDDILPFDLFPSILEFVGIDVAGDRLGLGYSAFNTPSAVPPPQRLADMEESLLNHSPAYIRLWSPRPPLDVN